MCINSKLKSLAACLAMPVLYLYYRHKHECRNDLGLKSTSSKCHRSTHSSCRACGARYLPSCCSPVSSGLAPSLCTFSGSVHGTRPVATTARSGLNRRKGKKEKGKRKKNIDNFTNCLYSSHGSKIRRCKRTWGVCCEKREMLK